MACNNIKTNTNNTTPKTPETSRDHLETKKQLENLRKQYGSEWLQSQAGDMVKNVIGFDPSTEKEFESVMHYESDSKRSATAATTTAPINTNHFDQSGGDAMMMTSTPVDRDGSTLMESIESPIKGGKRSDTEANESDFKSVLSDSNYLSVTGTTVENTKNSLDLTNIYGNAAEVETGEIFFV